MNILVCISNVPDTTSKINFKDENKSFDTNGVQFIINPNDEFGLTRAVWLQQKSGAKVTVVTVGDSSCEPILRKCLAIGADQAIRIDAVPSDGFYVANQLAALCKKENYDLIITGRESIDYNGSMVGGMLASLLSCPYVANCIQLDIEGTTVTLQREIDGGKETLSASLPLVLGAQKGLVEESDLIIPNMRGIMQARQKPLSVEAPMEIEAATTVKHFEKPQSKGPVKLVDADDVDTLIELLQNEAKVL
ncbi:electron transfer flavoprotein subunit beta/FixA family protein [Flavobacteriaceae bacterium]|jgi:electron transfer flavoprotein beta subunit|nr:electron transfer flavoprotein subunit beta/FixA family protein [Flavobacteriaceae bacterium]MDB4027465.1 electron transfer flavoprotein subunit beta/FixA family protein [bacterium]MDA9810884.1 electron transfer flavoprotein subunit beta/FixA family protein [Flavobacteriaceae bacterium]MDB4263565.1 electron transfer flavoprotein subunit beta/FixA family protein [Flavobacteriaceae bacterium]MDB4269553.1 electron transfer flavoprotein subunit beta/FixA family protein [Flavobacteriaceae bacteri|tara:strand:- start:8033 stop:8779 length:747 start_codon:yes stop_codon:yes gene_type:complete